MLDCLESFLSTVANPEFAREINQCFKTIDHSWSFFELSKRSHFEVGIKVNQSKIFMFVNSFDLKYQFNEIIFNNSYCDIRMAKNRDSLILCFMIIYPSTKKLFLFFFVSLKNMY